VTRDQHLAILEFLDGTLSADPAPLDVEADAIIRAYFKRHPDAAYRLTMRAMAERPAAARVAETPHETAHEAAHQATHETGAPAPRSWISQFFDRRETISP
jgi:hypothetical protein